jgi:integrase
MSEANSVSAASNPVGRYPDHAPGATPKPKLLDRLPEALRSRHYSRQTEETHYHISPRSFSAHLLEDGLEIQTIQEPLGHKDVSTTISLKQYNAKFGNWDFGIIQTQNCCRKGLT